MKRKESDKYLGQILHTNGARASCEATISDRESKIKGATFEIQSIVEDFKMQAIGGKMTPSQHLFGSFQFCYLYPDGLFFAVSTVENFWDKFIHHLFLLWF